MTPKLERIDSVTSRGSDSQSGSRFFPPEEDAMVELKVGRFSRERERGFLGKVSSSLSRFAVLLRQKGK